jgi:hypothetical protein
LEEDVPSPEGRYGQTEMLLWLWITEKYEYASIGLVGKIRLTVDRQVEDTRGKH